MQLREPFAQNASGGEERFYDFGKFLLAVDEFVDVLFKAAHVHNSDLQPKLRNRCTDVIARWQWRFPGAACDRQRVPGAFDWPRS